MTQVRTHNDIQEGRPLALEHMIGQERPVRQLRNALDAHVNDRAKPGGSKAAAFPHVLLVGPSGVGKSSLASIIANELAVNMHEELGQKIWGARALHGLLMMIEEQDCVFLDEVHELDPTAQTTLYRALEDRQIFIESYGDGESNRIDLPAFSMIAATTDEYRLSKPLRDRFKLILRLGHYSNEELAQVVIKRARRLGWGMTDASGHLIAKRGRGTPRIALRLLESAWRTSRADGLSKITTSVVKRALDIEGIDDVGLDPVEQRYLKILESVGGTCRLNLIATQLGLPDRTAVMFEADLLRLGLLGKDQYSMRYLTPAGVEHVKHLT